METGRFQRFSVVDPAASERPNDYGWTYDPRALVGLAVGVADGAAEGAKPKAAQPKKKETGKQSAAAPTQPAKKNDDHKRYVVRKCLLVMTKLSPAVCLSFIS